MLTLHLCDVVTAARETVYGGAAELPQVVKAVKTLENRFNSDAPVYQYGFQTFEHMTRWTVRAMNMRG